MIMVLTLALVAVSVVCQIIILIDAFKDEIWKGLLGLICGLYLLYYALIEFDHPNKWLVVLGWLLTGVFGGILWSMAGIGAGLAAP